MRNRFGYLLIFLGNISLLILNSVQGIQTKDALKLYLLVPIGLLGTTLGFLLVKRSFRKVDPRK